MSGIKNRRTFLQGLGVAASAVCFSGNFGWGTSAETTAIGFRNSGGIRVGLCSYLWGAKLTLNELLDVCDKAGIGGIELRCQHAHGVEPEMDATGRADVKKRFADAGIELVGFGTNEDFHHTDPAEVKRHLERAKDYVRLSADCGGFGVKVKPNDLPQDVDRSQTTTQIATALDELGRYAADFGQVIRLENHGKCSPVPIMKEIIDQVTQPNVGLCWNSNGVDVDPPGFEANLRSVIGRLGDTIHICNSPLDTYPYGLLCRILRESGWNGWLLIESHDEVTDLASDLIRVREMFEEWLQPTV